MKLLPVIEGLLKKRGVSGETEIQKFLNPSLKDLSDPFGLPGVSEAADRIKVALAKGESILIFGDYDADGVSASAILYLYLKSAGGDVNVYIPARADGYGLTEASAEKAAEEFNPDLVVTCDCGISCAAEVAELLDLGMDVIVTDHHELPETLPGCVTVNPKLCRDGLCAELCGAGVALKLVAALGGAEAAEKYLDLAAVATVADMVPLVGESRIIAACGLKAINKSPRPAIAALLSAAGASLPLRASDIAFKIAPRLNAAGRTGDAARAFRLLISDDAAETNALAAELEAENTRRREAEAALIAEAREDLKSEKLYALRAVVLSGPEWDAGVAGLAAARFCANFNRPAFIMSGGARGEDGTRIYKGTARGIEGMDVRAMLSSVSDCLAGFGGHERACGFSIAEENIPVFKERVVRYAAELPDGIFAASSAFDAEIPPDGITSELALAVEALEPFGTGNAAPLFCVRLNKTAVERFKNKAAHITVRAGKARLKGFNCRRLTRPYASSGEKMVLTEIAVNRFNGAEGADALIRDTVCGAFAEDIDGEEILCSYAALLAYPPPREKIAVETFGGSADAAELYADKAANIYGTAVVASRYVSYRDFVSKLPGGRAAALVHDYIYASGRNDYNRVILAPAFDFEAAFYENVIFLDTPPSEGIYARLAAAGCRVYAPLRANNAPLVSALRSRLDLSREKMGACYRIFSDLDGAEFADVYDLAETAETRAGGKLNRLSAYAAYRVFLELGLIGGIDADGGKLFLRKGVKRDLTESAFYNALLGFIK